MFSECINLTNIEPLQDWDISKVTNLSYMFTLCKK